MRNLSPRLIGSIGIVTLILLAAYANARTQRVPGEEIPQPSQRVAFVAQFVQTQPDGSRWVGDYYRRADQSFAMYGTHSAPTGGSTKMISITNAETLYHYLYREQVGHWVRVPIQARPSDKLLRYRVKTANTNGLIPEAAPVAGFSVYREQQGDGSLRLLAPDLNFFPLLKQYRSGMREEITDVKIMEPGPSLFLPPADAKVVDGKAPIAHNIQQQHNR